jgi:hypothetical protein
MVLDQKLLELKACEEARIWAQGKTWKEIFETCHRGDWLLWLFKKTIPDDEEHLKLLTRAKAHCALTVRHLMKDQRSITACEVALKFADGEATRDELRTAAAAAYAAYAATYAAYAAADAAIAAAAIDAADAYAATYAAYAATDTDVASKTKNQKETADICRKYLPIEIWKI